MIDDGTVNQKIRRASDDHAAVLLYQNHLVRFGYDLGSGGADGKYFDDTKNATTAFFSEIKVTDPDPDVLEKDEAGAVIEKCKAGFKTRPQTSTLGAALFAGLKAGALTDAENAFIVGLKGKSRDDISLDDKLRAMRLVYKAFLFDGASAAAAAGMTAQFATESGYGRAQSGKFNYFGVKEFPRGKGKGTLCPTWEETLPQSEIDMFKAEGHYHGTQWRDDIKKNVHMVDDYFFDFANLSDGLQHQIEFISGTGKTKLYISAWNAPTPEEYAKRVAKAGYAQETDYAQSLVSLLTDWDNYAKRKKGQAATVIRDTANADIDPGVFTGGFP
jgi:hypothetical protein